MALFTSKRERRLWAWTFFVVIAIYATLGLARTLALELRTYGLDFWLFLAGCLLVLVTILTQGLKVKPTGPEIFVVFGIAAAYFLVFVRMALTTERSHMIEYGIVAVFILEALSERKRNGKHVPVPWLIAIVLTIVVGAVDEFIQRFIPGRVFDTEDILFNSLAAVMAVGSSKAMSWVRNL